MNNNGNLFNQVVNDTQVPGKNQAVASLVLGILSIVMAAANILLEVTVTGGLILAIVGVVLAGAAKKRGNNTGIRAAGQILSIIGIVLNSLIFVACAGLLGCTSCLMCSAFGAALV